MSKYEEITSQLMSSPSLLTNITKTFHNAADSLKKYLCIPEDDENRFYFLTPDLTKSDKAFIFESNEVPGSSWEMKIGISFLNSANVPVGKLDISYVIRIRGNEAIIYACLSERSIKCPMASMPYKVAPIPIDSFSNFNDEIMENVGEFLHEIAANNTIQSPDSYIKSRH